MFFSFPLKCNPLALCSVELIEILYEFILYFVPGIQINGKRRRKKMDDKVTPYLNVIECANQTKKNDTKSKSTRYVPNVLGNNLNIQMHRNNGTVQQSKLQPNVNEQPLIDFCKLN